ncbi:MAG: response regulator [Verrucomicrobia bacterium]|nr:response regulator [Deltaproteobacteria bacterium]
MFNILVVDDEIMVCRGISLILSQSVLPLGEIFIAQNGFEALDLIRLERIDLVITDIQMEQMNGIELMETIFLENPAIPVLVLSAHGEFEYAQKAMKFGAKEYIVKPVRPDHLISIVGKALEDREMMLRSFEKDALTRKYHLQENSSGDPSAILPELVFVGTDEREAIELLAGLGYRQLEERFCLLLVKPDLKKGGRTDVLITSLRDRKLMKYACRNVVEETVKEWKPLVFDLSTGFLAAILQLSEQDALYAAEGSRAATIAQKVHNNLTEYLNVDNVIGISGVGVGIGSWPELYRDAERALSWHHVHTDHYVFYSGDFAPSAIPAEEFQADNPSEKKEDAKRRSEVRGVISEAKAYIDLNFQTKGLKLQDIAGTVHLSPNYLCYLFKKDLGLNMWDYVTECRMEEGKRLVLTTDMRRYEIADAVGYETPEHFSKIFKRHYGVSLSEFKK